MENEKLPLRSEVPVENTWNLSDMFESDDAWYAENDSLRRLLPTIETFRGKLSESAESLLSYFRLSDELSARLNKLYCYAGCKSDQDTADSKYLDMKGKAVSTYTAVAGADAFARPEIIAIPEETLERFYAQCPELEQYRRALYMLRRRNAHILSAAEEKLLAAAGELSESAEDIASALRDADLTFPSVTDSEGNSHLLTSETFVSLEKSEDRTLRENVFRTAYAKYGEVRNTLAASLNGQFRQLRFFAEARKYPGLLSAALDVTEVPVSVYENLIDTVHAGIDKMHRYISVRKRALKLDELHMYDVYVPLVQESGKEITFAQAKETVLEALAVLGEDYTALLREGFANRWIDVYENKGKRGGAYSSGNSKPHPYVLLNHKNDMDSMFTIAHEMGHALHSYHSNRNQPETYCDYVIFVAEVASTCNEVLLMRYLLNRTENRKERAGLVNHFLEEFRGTFFRQTMFAEFERKMGNLSESGQTLTADLLCEKYLELNRFYFGPDMVSDDEIALEWARIPHFFYNYYVFQYATGFAAAVAIADRILTLGEPAVEDYKRFLSGGCSQDPISLLKIAGVDMSTPEPLNAALKLFGELVDELETLL